MLQCSIVTSPAPLYSPSKTIPAPGLILTVARLTIMLSFTIHNNLSIQSFYHLFNSFALSTEAALQKCIINLNSSQHLVVAKFMSLKFLTLLV